MKNLLMKLRSTDWELMNRYVILTMIAISPIIIAPFGIGLLMDIFEKLSELK